MRIYSGDFELRINALTVIIPVVMLIAGCLKEYAAAFFSIAAHELGHIAAAGRYGIRPSLVSVTPVGLTAVIYDRGVSSSVLIRIYTAGPAVNLVLFAALSAGALVFPQMRENLELLSITNLLLAVFNLLPAFPLDGGRILQQLLSSRIGLLAAGRVVRALAWFLSVAILAAGTFQFFMTGGNISLLMIGIYIPIVLKDARMESAFMNIRQILYRRTKLLKKGVYPVRDLVVLSGTRIGELLNNMDFDRFHIIYVLDDDMRIAGTFTEKEIMDAFTSGGEDITFARLMEEKS